MAVEVAERLMSAEAYLEWESEQPFRNELIDNRIYPMPGGSSTHEDIVAAFVTWFFIALRDRIGHVYGGIQVMVDALATYTYPDVTVVVGEPEIYGGTKSGPVENPTLLFEVLSPSTETIDRNQKLEQYKRIPSLQAYYLVSQDEALIEAYTRAGDEWIYGKVSGVEARLGVPQFEAEIPLAFIYGKVKFEGDEMA